MILSAVGQKLWLKKHVNKLLSSNFDAKEFLFLKTVP
jgi:hypothetical protein